MSDQNKRSIDPTRMVLLPAAKSVPVVIRTVAGEIARPRVARP